MLCQICSVEAPTKYVAFYQNIGMLFMRKYKSVKGNLCKSCINKYFTEFTLITIGIGWLGTISIFIAPIFVINNIVRYLCCLGLPSVPPGATVPQLTEDVVNRINPYFNILVSRLNANEKLEVVAPDIARQAGTTPGQVIMYIRHVSNSYQAKK